MWADGLFQYPLKPFLLAILAISLSSGSCHATSMVVAWTPDTVILGTSAPTGRGESVCKVALSKTAALLHQTQVTVVSNGLFTYKRGIEVNRAFEKTSGDLQQSVDQLFKISGESYTAALKVDPHPPLLLWDFYIVAGLTQGEPAAKVLLVRSSGDSARPAVPDKMADALLFAPPAYRDDPLSSKAWLLDWTENPPVWKRFEPGRENAINAVLAALKAQAAKPSTR